MTKIKCSFCSTGEEAVNTNWKMGSKEMYYIFIHIGACVCVCVCVCVRICTILDKRGNQNVEINHRNQIWEAINSRPSLLV